jgi:hypothetical protein
MGVVSNHCWHGLFTLGHWTNVSQEPVLDESALCNADWQLLKL